MPKARIDINPEGVRALLKSREVARDLERRGRAIAEQAGDGMEAEPAYIGKNRARVTVRTATPKAKRAEAETRALTRAINAGRR